MRSHLAESVVKLRRKTACLHYLAKSYEMINTRTLLTLTKSHCLAAIDYAAEILIGSSPHNLKKTRSGRTQSFNKRNWSRQNMRKKRVSNTNFIYEPKEEMGSENTQIPCKTCY
ncbi:hypothetical protein MHBO_004863 [Bonamia ostreae]|uniref:Uncharacterized protein n=1 Tax=Bonamia ostreae TaxID=126728 RepID=A0ABV2AUI0_9EUKA